MLYEMLAGEPPFLRETPLATAMAHIHDPVPAVADRRPGLPEPLVATVHACLQKDPALRPASAAELADALHAGRAPRTGAPPTEAVPEVTGSDPGEDADVAERTTAALPVVHDRTAVLEAAPAASAAERPAVPRRRPRRTRRPSRRRVRPWMVILALAVAGLIAFGLLSSASPTTTMPNFVGLYAQKAEAAASTLGLDYRIRPVDDPRPRGLVVNQTPGAGTEVPSGGSVILFVSTGTAPAPSPPPGKDHRKKKHGHD